MTIEDFSTPLPLDPDNRWIRWADMIPWKKLNQTTQHCSKRMVIPLIMCVLP
jgi:hypothetical protein